MLWLSVLLFEYSAQYFIPLRSCNRTENRKKNSWKDVDSSGRDIEQTHNIRVPCVLNVTLLIKLPPDLVTVTRYLQDRKQCTTLSQVIITHSHGKG